MGVNVTPDEIFILKNLLMKRDRAFNALDPEFRKRSLHSFNRPGPIFGPHDQFADQGIIKRRYFELVENMGIHPDTRPGG